jgi:DNA primase
LGYAPDEVRLLLKNYPDDQENLIKAGLLIANENPNQPYDRFRDRIMFPIRNQKGAIIGFGARTLDANKEPKYLNSPETILFKKGQELYGLYEARQAIYATHRALVVEGYMDVIALSQYGIHYAVATLGTATTSEQLGKLLQYADAIYFCFDGDEAGQKAAKRALENSLPTLRDGKSLFFLFLPAKDDPDSFIRAHSGKLFEEKLLNESVPFSTYMIRLLVSDINTNLPEGRAQLIHRATPWVRQLNHAPLLGHMIKARLAELVNMTFNDFDVLFNQQSALQSKAYHYQLPHTSQRLSVTSIVYKQILTLLMNPSWAKEVVLPDMVEELSPELAFFVRLVETIMQHSEPLSSAYLMEHFRGTDCEAIMSNALKQIHDDNSTLMGVNAEAKTAFLDGNKKMIDDWLRHTQLKTHVDKLASKSYQASTTAEKYLLVELLKKS